VAFFAVGDDLGLSQERGEDGRKRQRGVLDSALCISGGVVGEDRSADDRTLDGSQLHVFGQHAVILDPTLSAPAQMAG